MILLQKLDGFTQFVQSHVMRYSSWPAAGAHMAEKYGKSAAT
jgi:hypothetical protein